MLWSYPRKTPPTLGREDCNVVCATLTNARMRCGSGTVVQQIPFKKSLRERHRIVHDTGPLELKEGEVVLVRSEEWNRGRRHLGIVTELIRGRDGVVRGAKLRSGTGYNERAIQHLYPLYLSCDRTTVESGLPNAEEVPNKRPKHSAAVAAKERPAENAHAEQELE